MSLKLYSPFIALSLVSSFSIGYVHIQSKKALSKAEEKIEKRKKEWDSMSLEEKTFWLKIKKDNEEFRQRLLNTPIDQPLFGKKI